LFDKFTASHIESIVDAIKINKKVVIVHEKMKDGTKQNQNPKHFMQVPSGFITLYILAISMQSLSDIEL